MKKTHSPNCDCFDCTGGDPYIKKLRNNFGKAANFEYSFGLAGRNGVYGQVWGRPDFNNYDGHFLSKVNHADELPKDNKANIKAIFGDAIGDVLGSVIQAKKDGKELPKSLDLLARLGIKTEQAAVEAGTKKAESEIGKNVLKFSPYIIGAIVVLVILVFYKK